MAYHLCTVHPEAINEVTEKMQSAYALSKMSNFLKVMADPTRLRIVNALLIRELCVCDIAALLGMEHSAVSHQLAVLRKIDVVNVRQEGKVKYYSLSDDHISTVFQVTLTHINE
ncbi:MAG: ArsR/SmtB family transcription factor [Acutalibacteraceae bacterium]